MLLAAILLLSRLYWFIDGVEFDGGKGETSHLDLGLGQFIPGFEDQLVGHSAGETVDVIVTFPEQ